MTIIASESARDLIQARLEQDLIGPRLPDERLRSRASDVYITGILWPRNTALPPEEDERLSVATGADEGGEDSADLSQAQSVQMRRPSAAGISFAATSIDTPTVQISVQFGAYIPTGIDNDIFWQREKHTPPPFNIKLIPGSSDICFASGSLSDLRLNVRTVKTIDGVLSTVTLVNDMTPSRPNRNNVEQCTIFQVELKVVGTESTRLISRPSRRMPIDDEDWSLALLYRDAHEFAAGHTCSADWDVDPLSPDAALSVRSTWLPRVDVETVSPDGHPLFAKLKNLKNDPLSAEWLSVSSDLDLYAALTQFCQTYADWINTQRPQISTFSGRIREAAVRHITSAEQTLSRMRDGINFIKSDPAAADSFRLANLVMNTQRQWGGRGPLRWRPFQLGYLLLTLHSSADGKHPDRNVMDLLWFPTGGGKTEAYLGLIAFIAFYRRLESASPDEGAGVAAVMRYTLRLLTTQQFIRATAMICACETVRRGLIGGSIKRNLGTRPFSIGLWVGQDATPNTRQSAFDSQSDPTRASAKQLTSCPCCGHPTTLRQRAPNDAVQTFCNNKECLLAGKEPIPVWTVDEDIYEFCPTLLIGTIDKFAQIVRRPETAKLMGIGGNHQPQLILQDELHLISGPLGTLAGLYESALDIILSTGGTKPKIIGSTATIRRAPEQVLALFDRETCQFPPLGLSADDSGFTIVDKSLPGRRYIGITTAGRSAKFTLQAVSASLLQTATTGLPTAQQDHYWTLVTYFNSLRELGGALVLMQDDVHDTIKLIADARNEIQRTLHAVDELTSRISQKEITGMLDRLEKKAGNPVALDVVLATNMVSVGVDISRLGLMVVNGQPKTMAEYIQATSRVGRGNVEGLVVAILNNAKPRDRSHFETFKTWHKTLYREVEATSVTPFASRARDRALHAALVAVVRHLVPDMENSPVLSEQAEISARDLIDKIAARAARVDPSEKDVKNELIERLNRWIRRSPQHYWDKFSKASLLQSAEEAAAKRASGLLVGAAWPTPNTMRGVEPSTNYRLAECLRRRNNGT